VFILGLVFTFASWVFARAVDEPHRPALSSCYHFQTDELLSLWMFTLGTVLSVPVMILYVAYNPGNSSFGFALFVCVVASVFMIGLTIWRYPKEGEIHKPVICLFVLLLLKILLLFL
jgi:uncharacterized membrane protein YccC